MRLTNIKNQTIDAAKYAKEYKAAERLFAVRFGINALFVPGLFRVKCMEYAQMRYAYIETEFVECLTSEFPAEYNVFRLYFCADQKHKLIVSVDSRVKAERILAKLAQMAPSVELRPEQRASGRMGLAKRS